MGDIVASFDAVAERHAYWRNKNYYYHSEIVRFYAGIIPQGKRVLEIGSGDGYLLDKLSPADGIGLDTSIKLTEIAKKNHPKLKFINTKIEDFDFKGNEFDYVVISNLLEYINDLYNFFFTLGSKINIQAKIIITGINPLWAPVMKIATKFKQRTPVQMKNFVTLKDMENILGISGYEIIESGYRMFLPLNTALISYFLNKLIPRLPLLRNICMIQYIIARKKQDPAVDYNVSCSVIIPCHNEEGNIRECIEKIHKLGNVTEIVVVDDGSTDRTSEIVKETQASRPNVRLISYKPNKGKGYAVTTGLNAASGDTLMILDADMAVAPEELPKFYNVLASHQAEFVNGTRMVYDMEPGAMKFLNYIGNKVFGIMLSFIMGQRNTDTLCGTKAFYKKDYKYFKMGKCPWGDFDLLFEAARMKLKTTEMPVRYYPRLEGVSKMKAFRHGIQLLKMCWYGFWYLG